MPDGRSPPHRLASLFVSDPVEGIRADNVTKWFLDHVPDVTVPLTFTLIAGGRSNLTFRVEDAKGLAWVLRRPPVHHVLPTAHDMVREHRLMSSLGPSGIPVPTIIGLCTDEAVNDRPFFVMEFVEGHIVRDASDAEQAFDVATRGVVGDHMAETLSALHDVEPESVGLGDLGRHEGYIERQLKRWSGRFAKCASTVSITAEWSNASGRNWPGAFRRSSAHRSCTAITGWTMSSSTIRARCAPSSTGNCARWATPWPTSASFWTTGPMRVTPCRSSAIHRPRRRASPRARR